MTNAEATIEDHFDAHVLMRLVKAPRIVCDYWQPLLRVFVEYVWANSYNFYISRRENKTDEFWSVAKGSIKFEDHDTIPTKAEIVADSVVSKASLLVNTPYAADVFAEYRQSIRDDLTARMLRYEMLRAGVIQHQPFDLDEALEEIVAMYDD